MRNFVNLNQLSTQAITSLIVASLAYKNEKRFTTNDATCR